MEPSPAQFYHLIITLVSSAAVGFGATKYAIRKHDKEILENRSDVKKVQDDLTRHVSLDFCRNERVDCKDARRETSIEINARFKELQATNAKTQELLSKIMNKLVELETKMDERAKMRRAEDNA